MCTEESHASLADQLRVLTATNEWLRSQLDMCRERTARAEAPSAASTQRRRPYSYPHAHIRHEPDGWHIDIADRDERTGVQWMRDVDVQPTYAAALAWLPHAVAVLG